jgi:hypothetical protein
VEKPVRSCEVVAESSELGSVVLGEYVEYCNGVLKG